MEELPCLVRNPKFTNTRFNEQAIPLKLTFTNPTGGAGFGTYLPLDIAIKSNWLKMLGFTPGTFQFE